MDKKLSIYELILDTDLEGVTNVSFVKSPATDVNFLIFNQERGIEHTFSVKDEYKKEVTGVIMLADTPIFRNNPEMGEHYVTFTKDVIKKLVLRFFDEQKVKNINLEHTFQVNGIFLFESYIVDRDRGVNPPNELKDIPDGSWIGSFKVNNEQVWEHILKGDFKGFSIEGFFSYGDDVTDVKDDVKEFEMIYKILQKIK